RPQRRCDGVLITTRDAHRERGRKGDDTLHGATPSGWTELLVAQPQHGCAHATLTSPATPIAPAARSGDPSASPATTMRCPHHALTCGPGSLPRTASAAQSLRPARPRASGRTPPRPPTPVAGQAWRRRGQRPAHVARYPPALRVQESRPRSSRRGAFRTV